MQRNAPRRRAIQRHLFLQVAVFVAFSKANPIPARFLFSDHQRITANRMVEAGLRG
jgi:hypothetical protein